MRSTKQALSKLWVLIFKSEHPKSKNTIQNYQKFGYLIFHIRIQIVILQIFRYFGYLIFENMIIFFRLCFGILICKSHVLIRYLKCFDKKHKKFIIPIYVCNFGYSKFLIHIRISKFTIQNFWISEFIYPILNILNQNQTSIKALDIANNPCPV